VLLVTFWTVHCYSWHLNKRHRHPHRRRLIFFPRVHMSWLFAPTRTQTNTQAPDLRPFSGIPHDRPARVCVRRTPAWYAAACLGGETVALAAEPVTISLRGYTDSMRCTWVITGVPPIELEFISFATELNYDFVTVYRGNGTDVFLRKFSGKDLPARLRVGASTMTVAFTSDGSGNQDGFVAVLTATGGCSRRRLGPATELWLHRSAQACPLRASRHACSHALPPHKRPTPPFPQYRRGRRSPLPMLACACCDGT